MTGRSEYDDSALRLGERREPYLKLALGSLAGPLCWILHFSLVYLLEEFTCRQGSLPVQLIVAAIIAATLVFGAACTWLLVCSGYWLRKAGGERVAVLGFLVSVNRMLAGLSLLAIVWVGAASLFLSPCMAAY